MKHIVSIFIVILVCVGFSYYNNIKIEELRQELNKVGANSTISALTELTSPSHNDVFAVVDTANTQTKKMKWGTATSTMKSILDAAYNTTFSPIFSTSAGLASLINDETGSGKAVFASSSVMESVRLITPLFNLSGTETKGNVLYLSDANGTLSQLSPPSGTGYFLAGSSTMDRPVWDNSPITFPYNSSSTLNATTTIAADSLTNRALILNSLAYAFPSSHANNVLKNDGSGNLTWGNPVKLSYAGQGPNASEGFATTTVIVIPPSLMTASSTIDIQFNASSNYNGGSGDFQLRKSTGETLVSVNCGGGTNGQNTFCHGRMLISFNSASQQRYMVSGFSATAAGVDSLLGTNGTLTTDFSSGLTLAVVADANAVSRTMNVNYLGVIVTP